jgi:hypothetical protein
MLALAIVAFDGAVAVSAVAPARDMPATRDTKVFRAQGVTFRYPRSWNVRTSAYPSTTTFPIAFLSNQRQHAPCTSTPGELSCGWSVRSLRKGGVYVAWSKVATLGNPPALGTTMIVDGHTATFSARGPDGTTDAVWMLVVPVNARTALTAQVAMRAPLVRTQRQVESMFGSTRITE